MGILPGFALLLFSFAENALADLVPPSPPFFLDWGGVVVRGVERTNETMYLYIAHNRIFGKANLSTGYFIGSLPKGLLVVGGRFDLFIILRYTGFIYNLTANGKITLL